MTTAQLTARIAFFNNQLGIKQIRIEEATKWGFSKKLPSLHKHKKAYLYLNTLNRYAVGGTNFISPDQAQFILDQLEKVLILDETSLYLYNR